MGLRSIPIEPCYDVDLTDFDIGPDRAVLLDEVGQLKLMVDESQKLRDEIGS
jgi:hypothetical protein